ncbi:MAG TPA: MFS transporter [Alphaproteobacteria bacterium]|nr:MFS transporter [Alphaproteobacteria bacterium]
MKRIDPLVAIFLTVFVDLIGFGIVIPLLPFYAEHFQASPRVVTLLMASYSLTQFVFAPVWGQLSDRYGRKTVLIVSLAGISAAYVWMGFAGALWELIAARGFAGAMAGNIAAAQAYIADVTGPEKRAQGMGVVGAAFGLGFIVGPALGGLLAGPDPSHPNFTVPALSSATLSLVALLLAALILKESLDPAARSAHSEIRRPGRFSSIAEALVKPELRILLVVFFLVTFVVAIMESTFALWSERSFGWGAAQNGYIFAYTGVVAAVVQGGLIRRLARQFGERRLVIQGVLSVGAGLALIPLVHTLPLLLVAMALIAYGMGVNNPSLSSLISLAAANDRRGGVLGVSQSAASLARIGGPAFAGVIFEAFGRNAPYVAGAAIMFAVLALALRMSRRTGSTPSGIR